MDNFKTFTVKSKTFGDADIRAKDGACAIVEYIYQLGFNDTIRFIEFCAAMKLTYDLKV